MGMVACRTRHQGPRMIRELVLATYALIGIIAAAVLIF